MEKTKIVQVREEIYLIEIIVGFSFFEFFHGSIFQQRQLTEHLFFEEIIKIGGM